MLRWPFRKGEPEPEFRVWRDTDRGAVRIAKVPYAGAFERWKRYRDRFGETGLWPVYLGSDRSLATIEDLLENSIGEAGDPSKVDVDGWFRDKWEELYEDYDPDDFAVDTGGMKPYRARNDGSQMLGLRSENEKELYLALIPCEGPTEIFRTLPFGDWNDCPGDDLHTALLRRWHQKYGAEPIYRSHDELELYIPRPPQNPDEAVQLALDHFAYAPDTGEPERMQKYAAYLLGAHAWYFWWD